MAKLSVTRLLDASRMLTTDAGKQLRDLIDYVNNVSSEVVRALRGGLTFSDNFSCKFAEVTLTHNVANILNTDGRTPVGIFPVRVNSSTYGIDAVSWWVDSSANVQIRPLFTPAPPASDVAQKVTLVILF